MKSLIIFWVCLVALHGPTTGQPMPVGDPMGIHKGRFVGVVIGSAAFYSVTLLLLGKTWYKKRVKFHSFNDNGEWLQMDKIGHATTAYAMSRGGYELFRWSGVDERASVITGGLLALLFQSTIEVFDGYSDGWGFSKGDMLANLGGTALFVGQQYAFNEQKVNLRYGFRKSIYAQYRPNLLGETVGVQMLKDYNAQQYWLSVNLASVLPVGPQFPRWLNVDVGYSASGMTGGHANPRLFDATGAELKFQRYRQFFISPDADLARLPINASLQRFVGTAQFFKLPAPSVEFNGRNGVRFHAFLLRKD